MSEAIKKTNQEVLDDIIKECKKLFASDNLDYEYVEIFVLKRIRETQLPILIDKTFFTEDEWSWKVFIEDTEYVLQNFHGIHKAIGFCKRHNLNFKKV